MNTRVLMVGGHPDDENTQLLAFLAGAKHVETAYLSLTRGDGGQNRIGNELGEALGVIRTEELLAARRIDGAHQYFTRAFDFGFSKSAEETFKHWPRDSILKDVITVVRSFRPHIIVAVFSGTPADGHGHHQVSGILAREAFDAAGDAVRFPPSYSYGLPAWTPLKLYGRGAAGTGSIAYNVGEYSPVVGRSFGEIAGASRSQHRSQGFGSLEPSGPRMAYARLEKSRVGAVPSPERSIFEGIDTTWNRFRSLPGAAMIIDSLMAAFEETRRQYNPFEPSGVLKPLMRANALLRRLCVSVNAAQRCALTTGPGALLTDLAASQKETFARIGRAIILASGITMEATVTREVLALGSTPQVSIALYNGGRSPVGVYADDISFGTQVQMSDMARSVSGTWPQVLPDSVRRFTRSLRATGTMGPWWLESPRVTDIFAVPLLSRPQTQLDMGVISEDRRPTLGAAGVALEIDGASAYISAPITYRYVDPVLGEIETPAVIAPAITVTVDRDVEFVKVGAPYDRSIKVSVTSASAEPDSSVTVSLRLPRGITADSARRIVSVPPGSTRDVTFRVRGQLAAGKHAISAVAERGGIPWTIGYMLVDYPHIRRQRVYRSATIAIQAVDIAIPARLKVAYIQGVGDNVAPVLKQMGVPITIVQPNDVATTDLSQFTTVVVGPRAYDTSAELVAANPKLFDFVRKGGTMVVQFGQNMNRPGVMPLPVGAAGNQDRVTEENAPVRILDPASPLLNVPNKIGPSDFAGWVQERATYMPRMRDTAYKPLLAMGDTGEAQLDGGLLVAKYGEGTYIYCGLALFRQVPAGVPGGARILVNLMSGGKTN